MKTYTFIFNKGIIKSQWFFCDLKYVLDCLHIEHHLKKAKDEETWNVSHAPKHGEHKNYDLLG